MLSSKTALFATLTALSMFHFIPAIAAECDGRLVYVDDPSNVGDNYPLFMETRRNIYVMRGRCFVLSGSEFRGSITFFTLSRAPKGFSGTYGELIIKSIRTFNIPTHSEKIALTRNKGWFLPDGTRDDNMKAVPPIPDVPVGNSISDWDSLYTDPGKPEAFKGLNVKWHAYPAQDRLFSSLTWPDFWKLSARDYATRTVTNYLLRFSINPNERSRNPVPFYVSTPNTVKRVDLSVKSNVGSLNVHYTFILQ